MNVKFIAKDKSEVISVNLFGDDIAVDNKCTVIQCVANNARLDNAATAAAVSLFGPPQPSTMTNNSKNTHKEQEDPKRILDARLQELRNTKTKVAAELNKRLGSDVSIQVLSKFLQSMKTFQNYQHKADKTHLKQYQTFTKGISIEGLEQKIKDLEQKGGFGKVFYKGYYYKIRIAGSKKFILTKHEGEVPLHLVKKHSSYKKHSV